MKNCIEIQNIYKEIDGNTILKDVSVTLESGKIYGFIGRNGSGKTMLFRVIAGFIKPSAGKMICNNQLITWGQRPTLRTGIMIENAGLYPDLSGFENLKFLASIQKQVTTQQIREAIMMVGLNPNDKRKIKKYSLGMKQRLTFAQAILEKPELLLLDEPTNALDAEGVQLIRDMILKEKERDVIICIASHNKEDIEILCDEIYEMREGSLYKKEQQKYESEKV